jgi:hypothetical protein
MEDDLFNEAFYENFGSEKEEIGALSEIDNKIANLIYDEARENWIPKDVSVDQVSLNLLKENQYFHIAVGRKYLNFPKVSFLEVSRDLLLLLDNKGIDYLKEFIIAFDQGEFQKITKGYGILFNITEKRSNRDDVTKAGALISRFLGEYMAYMKEENFHHAVELFIHVLRKGAEYEK